MLCTQFLLDQALYIAAHVGNAFGKRACIRPKQVRRQFGKRRLLGLVALDEFVHGFVYDGRLGGAAAFANTRESRLEFGIQANGKGHDD